METPSDQEPPVRYVAYPRGKALTGAPVHGSAEKLQALADGYFGLGTAGLLNILLVLIALAASVQGIEARGLVAVAPALIVVAILIGFATYPYTKKVGLGLGWNPTTPAIVSLLLGINSPCCFGVIGFPLVQTLASNEFKRYGIKPGLFGISRKKVARVIAQFHNHSTELEVPVFQFESGTTFKSE